jgi:putative mRNA 3-end processing factor
MPADTPLLTVDENGLYCAAGDFHVDPWRPVPRAVITHAHADHARPGSGAYLAAASGLPVLRARLGPHAVLDGLRWEERRRVGGVALSLHPAGHLLGSAQVRVEHRGEVWVVSGDYRREADSTCEPFAPVRCHTFVTESTFGLPVFRWAPAPAVLGEIAAWWRDNAAAGRPSVVFAYALGKAQRLLAGLVEGPGPLVVHGAVRVLADAYREAGVALPRVATVHRVGRQELRRALVVAPPSAQGSPWMRRFPGAATAFVSGWMALRRLRRQRRVDRGFALSDHVDWPSLQAAVEATGATRVAVTHGFVAPVVRWLREERGLDAWGLETRFEGEGQGEDGLAAAGERAAEEAIAEARAEDED